MLAVLDRPLMRAGIYSAFGSFYIPSCIMVFVYIKIYYAARDRARRNLMAKRKS